MVKSKLINSDCINELQKMSENLKVKFVVVTTKRLYA